MLFNDRKTNTPSVPLKLSKLSFMNIPKNIVKVYLLSKENDFSFGILE